MLEAAAVLLAFVAFVALVHAAAVVHATRSRDDQLRHPRYWGR